jgi:hypothetical protein
MSFCHVTGTWWRESKLRSEKIWYEEKSLDELSKEAEGKESQRVRSGLNETCFNSSSSSSSNNNNNNNKECMKIIHLIYMKN